MSERLDLLRPYLQQYKRKFTVLDFGAGINAPAIGTEIVREFDAAVVCVEKDIVTPEPYPHTIWLKKIFEIGDLIRMSECEFFDVVIGFNVCHWFGSSALKTADTLRRMGRIVFLQSPHGDDTDAIAHFGAPVVTLDNYFRRSGFDWKHLGNTVQFPQHRPRPLWMFESKAPFRVLTKTHIDAHADSAYTKILDDHQKCIARLNKSDEFIHWIPGINLYNFLQWNGILPTRDAIVEWLKDYPLPAENHGDITEHNFIIDGERLHLVDGFEPSMQADDRSCLNKAIIRVACHGVEVP